MTERRLLVSAGDWFPHRIRVRGEQAHHLKDVLRARIGETFEFIDGHGRWARAMVEAIPTRDYIDCQIKEQTLTPAPGDDRFVLMQALIRFEKFEWILEKATELGVTKIIPLITARTEAKWSQAAEAKRDRWEKILVESIKQCRRLHLPCLAKSVRFEEGVSHARADLKILLSEKPDTPSFKSAFQKHEAFSAVAQRLKPELKVILAIGPEGGWSKEELVHAEASGFTPASMGTAILRAETAAVAGLSIVHHEIEG